MRRSVAVPPAGSRVGLQCRHSWLRSLALLGVGLGIVFGLMVAPHLYYRVDGAARLLQEGRGQASTWSGMAAAIERGALRLLASGARPGSYAEAAVAADREVAALRVALVDLSDAARASAATTDRLGRLPLPRDYHTVLEVRWDADRERIAAQDMAEELVALVAAQLDSVRPILLREHDFDNFTARLRALSGASLVAEAVILQRDTQALHATLADAVERAVRHQRAGRLPAELADYLALTLAAMEDFDALVAGAQAHDEEAVQRTLARLRGRAQSLAATDPGAITEQFQQARIMPLIAAWSERVRDIQRRDTLAARIADERRLQTSARWSW